MIALGEIVLIHDLKRQGLGVSAIARQTGLDRKTVRKYLARGLEAPEYKPRAPRVRIIEPYEAYLQERLTLFPDLTARRLMREIRARGPAVSAPCCTQHGIYQRFSGPRQRSTMMLCWVCHR
ncbi:hypothetical protein MACH17_06280 [Phaeobacter inhibens]|nr:hypothetical protein MACH17_06280 [Phaeobacter inhibens]